jgi:transposase
MRRAPAVRLHGDDRRQLQALAHARSSSPKLALRARIVLGAASGQQNVEIARHLRTSPGTVSLWRRRFLLHGVAGVVKEAPRPGRPPVIPNVKIQAAIRAIVEKAPSDAPYWSTRRLARELGMSKSTVQRIWKARGIDPRRIIDPFRPDRGLSFLERVTDLVGVYLNPPERAVAFTTDERARATRLKTGKRAALTQLRRRQRGAEFRAFLQMTDRETPRGLDVHLLVDSRVGPAPPEVQRWLAQHPRFHVHFLPSDEIGLTLIDRLIGEFSRRRTRQGGLASAQRLRLAIRERQGGRTTGRAFVWTATAPDIRGAAGRPAIP